VALWGAPAHESVTDIWVVFAIGPFIGFALGHAVALLFPFDIVKPQ
jgi:hypothetical protein